ncbi:hypothetical protein KQX54_017655 [Cotesia glomerata]|uniref:Uncharacterized protein n=1 Tax=Cotesia glomerata TaxID=32391 RepID=A0AAV7IWK4_COTGL|nr:hypothetical protein KQX54_017655 [Cotesia glomerata]
MLTRSLLNSAIVDNVLLNNTSRHQRSEIAFESKDYALDAQITCLCSLHDIVEPDGLIHIQQRGAAKARRAREALRNEENAWELDVEDEEELYESMEVSKDDDSAKYTRFNTLHMRGTGNMSPGT